MIYSLTSQIAKERDLDSMCHLLINGFSHVAHAPQCSLVLPKEKKFEEIITYSKSEKQLRCPKLETIDQKMKKERFWEIELKDICGQEQGECLIPCSFESIRGVSMYDHSGNFMGFLVAYFPNKKEINNIGEEQLLMEIYASQVALSLENAVLNLRLRKTAITDALTELYNHRYFQEILFEKIELAERWKEPLALALLDVDNFKGYNDTFGHPAGDIVLKNVALTLKENLGKNNIVARYGGEEFVVVMPEYEKEDAYLQGEKIVQAIAETDFPKREITVSMGLAMYPLDAKTPSDLIEKADLALYEAKRNGKNRLHVFHKVPS